MTNLFGLTLPQLQQLCSEFNLPRYTAKQMCDWLYVKRVDSIDQMTNLSLATRRQLSEVACIGHTKPIHCQVSKDGTKKYLFSADGLHPVEAVLFPTMTEQRSACRAKGAARWAAVSASPDSRDSTATSPPVTS